MPNTTGQHDTPHSDIKRTAPYRNKKEDVPCILDQLDLGEINTWLEKQQQAARKLLCDYTETFSKNDLDLGKCNILKHNIQLTDQQPFKKR